MRQPEVTLTTGLPKCRQSDIERIPVVSVWIIEQNFEIMLSRRRSKYSTDGVAVVEEAQIGL